MGLLSLLQVILQFAGALTGYLQQRRTIELAQSEVIKNGLEVALDTIKKANEARKLATDRFDATGGVPDSTDPNLRD